MSITLAPTLMYQLPQASEFQYPGAHDRIKWLAASGRERESRASGGLRPSQVSMHIHHLVLAINNGAAFQNLPSPPQGEK